MTWGNCAKSQKVTDAAPVEERTPSAARAPVFLHALNRMRAPQAFDTLLWERVRPQGKERIAAATMGRKGGAQAGKRVGSRRSVFSWIMSWHREA